MSAKAGMNKRWRKARANTHRAWKRGQMLPLNQRFTETAVAAMPWCPGPKDDQREWLLRNLSRWSRDMDTSEGMPGWDADGREVDG
jgi:hypothetical protein